jgi:beta-lactamase regulating signal transducer with metallopeptidase domain
MIPDFVTASLQVIGTDLLASLILSAVIFVGSIAVFRLIFHEQRWSACTRYRVTLLTFLAVVITPLLVVLKPAAAISDPPRTVQMVEPDSKIVPVASRSAGAVQDRKPAPKNRWEQPGFWLRWVDWLAALAALWPILSSISLCRLTLAMNGLRRLHRSARPLTFPTQLRPHRKISIARSSYISSPVAVGLWSPKVLLPPDFESHFSAREQENVLHHEVAHLERFDDWLNLARQLILALFPMNPILWILSKRLQLQQEIACDDWALSGADRPKDYASLLARLAAQRGATSILASGVSRDGKQLYRRVSRILDETCNRDLKPSWRGTLLAILGLIGIVTIGLTILPAIGPTPWARAAEPQEDNRRPHLGPEVIALLKNSALNDADAGVRREAVNALVNSVGDDATDALLALLDESKDEQVKLLILYRLSRQRISETKVKEKLNDIAVSEQSVPIRRAALGALARNLDDSEVEKFISIYRSGNEASIKQACLRGLAGASSKAAKDFLMSVAKDDPDPVMRRVAVRAVSDYSARRLFIQAPGETGNRIFLRKEQSAIDGKHLDDLEYAFAQLPDDPEEMAGQPEPEIFDLPDDSADIENEEGGVITQRLQHLKDRIRMMPLPKIKRGQSESPNTVPALPESPSNQPSASPSPQ